MPPLANCFYKFTSFLPEGIYLLFVYGNFMENHLKKHCIGRHAQNPPGWLAMVLEEQYDPMQGQFPCLKNYVGKTTLAASASVAATTGFKKKFP